MELLVEPETVEVEDGGNSHPVRAGSGHRASIGQVRDQVREQREQYPKTASYQQRYGGESCEQSEQAHPYCQIHLLPLISNISVVFRSRDEAQVRR